MDELVFICKELWRGKSVLRAYLNLRLCKETLRGATIDIGGGSGWNYLPDMKRAENVSFQNLDIKVGARIDFEKDQLPAPDGAFDTVLFLNVMEHVFNYQHIANEVVRITKPDGQVIGFVPFLMWYHADHRDFFRYTHEALEIIGKNTGARSVTVESVASGPFIAAAHMVTMSLPRPLRVLIVVPCYLFDRIFRKLRPNRVQDFALGYFFTLSK
jgi:SAM-dependent methyltransferase